VAFSLAATGTAPLAYQWRCNGTDLPNFANVSGAFGPTLTISNVQPQQAGSYSVEVQNAGGSVVSATAALTVLFPPTLIPQHMATNGRFAFSLLGNTNAAFQVEVSTNLASWSFLATVTNTTGQVQFIAPSDSHSRVFYRARLLP